jgi:hypothetical protein
MARINSTVSFTGDETFTFHSPQESLVMLDESGLVTLTFPSPESARVWLSITYGNLVQWIADQEVSDG